MKYRIKTKVKKASAAVLSTLLLCTTTMPAWAGIIQTEAEVTSISGQINAQEQYIPQTGYVADIFSEKRQDTKSEEYTENLYENLKASAQVMPSEYRTEKLPAIKNQGIYGTCWAFSTIACLEINLMKKGYPEQDLSELQLAYFSMHSVNDKLGGLTGDDYAYSYEGTNYLMFGGNYQIAANALSDWLAAAKEESVPYEMAADTIHDGLDDQYAYAGAAHLQNYQSYNMADVEEVKQAVMDYGAVGISYYAYTGFGYSSNKYYDSNTAGYYCYDELGTNHAVTIVGWDDDYSADNFPTAPEGNGAWFVRNSWGSGFGEDGYFYLSYYDKSISGSAIAFDAEAGDNYDNNYQYDGSAFGSMIGMTNYKAANMFTAKANENGEETIKAASFEVRAKAFDYTVSIYTGITDESNPVSGELKAQKSGSFSSSSKNDLIRTVVFDEPVTIKQGQKFSVVVELAAKNGDAPMIYYDRAVTMNGITSNTTAQENQSYLYTYYWMDFCNSYASNLRIKAFTDNVVPEVLVESVKLNKNTLELECNDSEQLVAEVLPENAANKNVIWTSDNEEAAVVSKDGTVTAKAPGSAVITVKTENGEFKDTCIVTVIKHITDVKIKGVSKLKAGDKAALAVEIYPNDTTDDTTVVWNSSDSKIAVVDKDGLVTAVSAGTVDITAQVGTKTAYHKITVTEPETEAPKPTEAETKPTESTTKPTEAETKPTEPATKPTEAETKPTEPATKPTEAETKPTEPATKPTEAETKPTEPATKPTEAETKPTEPATKPTEAETKPTEPATKPTEAETKPTENVKNGWYEENGGKYWYENGEKQGLEGRGKEIYDPVSKAWYWLDAVQGGKMTVNKDVYQESFAGIYADKEDGTGKWVRYDEQGHMIKGEYCQNGQWYRFDEETGAMVKGRYEDYYYDKITGQMVHGAVIIDDKPYAFDDVTGKALHCRWYEADGILYWYENGIRQGLEGRGKEIYDPAAKAWYWLDSVLNGAMAVSKDVYQESFAGAFADREDGTGKWVRYDEQGHMIKGWDYQNEHTYFFDYETGAMAKGTMQLLGVTYIFDKNTGIMLGYY